MNNPDQPRIEALLFDLGGVMIDIDFERIFSRWARLSTLTGAQIRERFAVDTAYLAYERGQLDSSAYFNHLRRLLELDACDEDIACGWNAIFVAEITEAVTMVHGARARLPCFAFTNTNPVHQASWSSQFPAVVAAFDDIFVSSELGVRKPEQRAFETVVQKIGVDPASVLFFDDLPQNVAGAEALGIRAVQVRSPQDIRRALTVNALL